MKRLPIKRAKDVANKYNQDQVIIVCRNNSTGITHVVTYGKSIEDCEQAAIAGNNLKRYIGFPEKECQSVPTRIKRKGIQK